MDGFARRVVMRPAGIEPTCKTTVSALDGVTAVCTVRSRQRRRVVDFSLVDQDVAVHVETHRRASVPDEPRHLHRILLAEQERDAAVSEVVRAERRDPAGLHARVIAVRNRSPPKPAKTWPSSAILARHSRSRRSNTAGQPAPIAPAPSSRRSWKPANGPRLVDVTPRESLELADRIPVASSTSIGSRYAARDALDDREHVRRRSAGRLRPCPRAAASPSDCRAGFGWTSAWSNTIASVISVFRIVSRFNLRRASSTTADTSAGVRSAGTRSPILGSTRARSTVRRSPRCVRSRRDATPATAQRPSGTWSGCSGSTRRRLGTRIAASSPATQSRRIFASRIVGNVPAARGTSSRPPARHFTR